MSYTIAKMQLSDAAYKEIRDKLEAAKYHHLLTSPSGLIDMHGIGVMPTFAPGPSTLAEMNAELAKTKLETK